MKAIILGANRGVRRLSSVDSYPRALIEDPSGRRVLDWILSALSAAGFNDLTFVGGYHIEKLVAQYPQLRYFYNPQWDRAGSLSSLFCAEDIWRKGCLVVSADYVFHPEAVQRVLAEPGDVVMAVGQREGSTPEFAGLVRLSETGARHLGLAYARLDGDKAATLDIQDVVHTLARDASVVRVPMANGWTRVSDTISLARFVMGTKGQTLERLRRVLRTAEILDQVRFTVGQWEKQPNDVMERVRSAFSGSRLIVRSSAEAEDGFSNSQAGRFKSVLDVPADDQRAVRDAIGQVRESFDSRSAPDTSGDEIFIQPFVTDVVVSGVVFTRDLDTGAPYVVINYDDRSGRSDTVTAGDGDGLPTAVVFRDHLEKLPLALRPLAPVIEELRTVTECDDLDIEFAITRSGRIVLLQARPLTVTPTGDAVDERDLIEELKAAGAFVKKAQRPHPLLLGETTLLTDMTDWNPAEIIGARPRPLAASLYRALVTDSVWSESRRQLGYRDVTGIPLMAVIAGKPYIDVRADFNSFIPASVPDIVAGRLVDMFVRRLAASPQLQDKVEFEIVPTCLDFDFRPHGRFLVENGLDPEIVDGYRGHLRVLTQDIVTERVTPPRIQQDLIDELSRRRRRILETLLDTPLAVCQAIDLLVKDCARFGTLPFANVARHAFIATAFLHSLVSRGCFSSTELEGILVGLPTVASRITKTIGEVVAGRLPESTFVSELGHLRPGTYDITVPSYAEAPHLYMAGAKSASPGAIDGAPAHSGDGAFHASMERHSSSLSRLLKETGFGCDSQALIHFIARSIPSREAVKFEFSKSVDAILTLTCRFGDMMDLSREEISFVPVAALTQFAAEAPKGTWLREIRRQAALYQKQSRIAAALKFPSVIASPSDVYGFVELQSKPNFITSKRVTAQVTMVHGPETGGELKGCIAAIESADPGYDWLLTCGIAGLVTKYGGVASHMAIRCAEFGLPAAIGCGETLFQRLRHASIINLDCATHRIERVS